MKLIVIMDHLDHLNDDLVILVTDSAPIQGDVDATIGLQSELVETEKPPEGWDYFLEVNLAKEVVEVWANWRIGKSPNRNEKLAALIDYVQHDAYLPGDT